MEDPEFRVERFAGGNFKVLSCVSKEKQVGYRVSYVHMRKYFRYTAQPE
jgi:hypothetical protein